MYYADYDGYCFCSVAVAVAGERTAAEVVAETAEPQELEVCTEFVEESAAEEQLEGRKAVDTHPPGADMGCMRVEGAAELVAQRAAQAENAEEVAVAAVATAALHSRSSRTMQIALVWVAVRQAGLVAAPTTAGCTRW
jgi:hypothetical protein